MHCIDRGDLGSRPSGSRYTRVMPGNWARCTLGLALASSLLAGCQNQPINPFLARQNPTYEQDAENPNSDTENPLADSLARLQNRKQEFRDAATAAGDAAVGMRDEAQAVARDTLSETRQALATSLDAAESQGRQLAADAVVAASATAQHASREAQLRAVASLEDLPLDQAGPILLATMSQGTPVSSQAAAEQLARRWPPAAGMPRTLSPEERAAAVAELRDQWIRQFGHVDEAIARANAEAARAIDTATQYVDQATHVVQSAQQQLTDVREIMAAYRQADLPASARQELALSLERMTKAADTHVRIQSVQAMGETGDPVFLPALMAMLNDQPAVQSATLDSLTRVVGQDVTARADGKQQSNEERARVWQLWYREQQAFAEG